jgi:N-acyl-D-aspartate/D-glutamate deacylase
MTDLVVKGGLVVDGSGAPATVADVAVTDGRIEQIGSNLQGSTVLDATGQVVAPGFFDIHTHYDAQVLWDPALTPSAWHGVTSVVAGNCGFSFAPCRPTDRELVMRTLERVEDMPYASLAAGIDWDFETYAEYLDAVARRGTAINFGGYVGHSTVRINVMGEDAYERAATDAELHRMEAVVAESVRAGALGFSTSTIALHRGWKGKPVPSNVAGADELTSLIRAAGRAGCRVVQASPEGDFGWLYPLQTEVGCNLTWSALLAYPGAGHSREHRARLEAVRAGRKSSGRVWAQVSPRPITAELTMTEPVAFFVVPAFSEISELDESGKRQAYASDQWRARAWEELESHRYRDPLWASVRIADSRRFPELAGRRLVDVAADNGANPLEAMLDIALADGLLTRFHVTVANDDPQAVSELLQEPGCVLGLSDAGAHVGQLCDAVLPTDFLATWVRELGVFRLEQGIRKLTGELAEVVNVRDRGYLCPGAAADVVVFDLDRVGPGPIRRVADLPGGADRLVGDDPTGLVHLIVNGTPVIADGHRLTGTLDRLPGALLRSDATA